ncbi:MAG: HNH endonuclease signature motif containing protein [Balneola sp.]
MSSKTSKSKPRCYTSEEIAFIKNNYEQLSDKEIADHLGRTAAGVKSRRQREGWVQDRGNWTEEELDLVKNLYPDTDNKDILKKLPGRTLCSLYGMANKVGVKKSDAYIGEQQRKAGKKLSELGLGNRYKKGDVPMNKGMKQEEFMSAEAIEKCKETQFKKGQKPHNTKFDGAISLRKDSKGMKYLWIRISKANWQEYHRYLWEKHNGEIPEGKIIVFKDGNQMNCSIDNLEAITRCEHADRNRNWERSMETMMEKGNHPGIHLTDAYVASHLAGHDKDLKEYILEHCPDLIKVARANYKLKRAIKNGHNDN